MKISDERLRNTRAWAAVRIGQMSGAEVIVGAIDELLDLRTALRCKHGVLLADRCYQCYPWTAEPSGMEIAQQEAEEAAGDNDLRDRPLDLTK